jgi:hypothetical protein
VEQADTLAEQLRCGIVGDVQYLSPLPSVLLMLNNWQSNEQRFDAIMKQYSYPLYSDGFLISSPDVNHDAISKTAWLATLS